MSTLAHRDARTHHALRFNILTAARTDEVVAAGWAEFDIRGKF